MFRPRNSLKRLGVGLAALTVAVTLGGCATGGADDSGEGTLKVGLAVPNQQSPFFVAIRQSLEAEAKAEGVDVVFADAKNDSDAQVSQIQDFITQGVDAIVYIPAGATAATVPVRSAKEAGIPIVTVDRNPDGAPGDTFIATDSVSAAEALGEWVVEQTGGQGELGIIQGQVGTTPEQARDEGFQEGIAGSDIVEVARQASTAWLQDEGYDIASDMLQAHPDITILFGRADGLALGAAQAAQNAGLEEILVVGFDGDPSGLQAVADGELGATITQQTTLMGALALDSAVKLIAGEEVPAEQLQDGILTTKDNVQDFITTHP
ncbi:substrate-binding domain-containing protein [Herbiconiux moechotypicola]|uniref:Sugar ABC transporter substrate-binding protein n=1 Tax=Herbiconiux moechotypicola TaxID=637393 RepID=A0ABP5R665_9MICO|nr:substrate-binding domain-containing protein [Herbiconiux moechotypicola]MCS5732085.1 substrate-binding domain-containing protein [Herbiconiux moechotypicola]